MVYREFDLTDPLQKQAVDPHSSWKSHLEISAIISLAILIFLMGFGTALISWPLLDFWSYGCWPAP